MELASFERLFVAAAVGFLIGLDRERAEARKARRLFAGVRTFPLIALAGAVPQLLPGATGLAMLVIGFVAVASVTLVSYVRVSAAGAVGATTEMAAIVTFLLGALAGSGEVLLAAAGGVGVALLLVAKPRLETFSRTLRGDELFAALELAVISVIVLPLLPDRRSGPWGALNPREIWLVVVLVSAVSFVGFIATRLLGPRRGMAVSGAVGGLVSSTAVTMAMAERSRAGGAQALVAAAATVFASVVMCIRVGVLVAAVNSALLPAVSPMLLAMTAVGLLAAWLLGRIARRERTSGGARLANPFRLRAALSFGALYALVLLIVRGAQARFGEQGLYLAAALSAVADVDAPTIALARLAHEAAPRTAVAGITIAVVTNTLVKLALAVLLGSRPLPHRRRPRTRRHGRRRRNRRRAADETPVARGPGDAAAAGAHPGRGLTLPAPIRQYGTRDRREPHRDDLLLLYRGPGGFSRLRSGSRGRFL